MIFNLVINIGIYLLHNLLTNAETNKKRCGIVQIPVLGEKIGLAHLSSVLRPIRAVVALHEGGDDRVVCRGVGEQHDHHQHCTEHDRSNHLDNMALLSFLACRGIAQILRHGPLWLGRSAWSSPGRLGCGTSSAYTCSTSEA